MFRTISVLFISAFALCYYLIPIFEKFAKARKLVTNSSLAEANKRHVPYLGGPAMFIVFCLVCIMGNFFSAYTFNFKSFVFFLGASLLIVLFGLYDDIREFTPVQKLVGQFLAAIIVVAFVVRTQIIFLPKTANIVLSIVWIIVLANAFNLLDILDGLAGVVSSINILTFFVLGIFTNNHFVILVSAIMLAVLLAFLRYNLPPARVFMGDAGSQFLGFVQAILAMSLSYASSGREIGLVVPLVLLAVPLFDLLFVIIMRIRQGKSIFLKSNDHFVFRMLEFGITSKAVLQIMVVISLITNICALVIFELSNVAGSILFCVLLLGMIIFGRKLSRLEMNR